MAKPKSSSKSQICGMTWRGPFRANLTKLAPVYSKWVIRHKEVFLLGVDSSIHCFNEADINHVRLPDFCHQKTHNGNIHVFTPSLTSFRVPSSHFLGKLNAALIPIYARDRSRQYLCCLFCKYNWQSFKKITQYVKSIFTSARTDGQTCPGSTHTMLASVAYQTYHSKRHADHDQLFCFPFRIRACKLQREMKSTSPVDFMPQTQQRHFYEISSHTEKPV